MEHTHRGGVEGGEGVDADLDEGGAGPPAEDPRGERDLRLDLTATGADRTASAADRIAAAADRHVARADRRHAALDRQILAVELHAALLGDLVLDPDAPVTEQTARAAEQRDLAAQQRDQDAERRDEAAELRDSAAAQREALSRLRDRLAQLQEGPPSAAPADARRRSALERAQAALDREQAVLDRLQSVNDPALTLDQEGLDRAQAAIYLAQSALHQAQVAEERAAAETDELTGASRREAGLTRLNSEVARAERVNSPLTVVFADVDGLKAVNDSRGHIAGDVLLRTVGSALRRGMRPYDIVLRFGGDEFVCVMPDVAAEQVRGHLEQVRATLAAAGISLSIGLASYQAGDDAQSLIARADADMYRSRASS
jgi:diguanylate cyclase (GGDEF)-like protein